VLYLMICTRPDLAHAVRVLSSYLKNYSDVHVSLAKHVLRYIRGTSKFGLLYTANGSNNITTSSGIAHSLFKEQPVAHPVVHPTLLQSGAQPSTGAHPALSKSGDPPNSSGAHPTSIITSSYSDANYGGDPESLQGNPDTDYKSISGSFVFVSGNLILWLSKKQKRVSQSSCESELYAAVITANELCWINSFLNELSFPQSSPSLLHCDNQAVISTAKTLYVGDKLKHVAIKWHVLKGLVSDKTIQIEYINTKSQLADILTKSLKAEMFIPLRNQIVFMV
jgi:hypothetical protein